MDRKPTVSRREQELLDELEIIKRSKKRITVIGFCKLMGYANKSALRHFTVLKQELSLYVAQFTQLGNKGSVPSPVRHLEVQVKRLNRKVGRLEQEIKEVPKLKAKIVKQRAELKQCSDDKRQLQGMISTLIAFLSNSDLAKARDLSSRLKSQARALLEEKNLSGSEEDDESSED